MPKRSTERARRRERDQDDQPPKGMTRRQRRDWFDELNRRRALESATVADAFPIVNTTAEPVAVEPVDQAEPKQPGRLAKLWRARPLFAALGLIAGLLYVIVPTQIDYYRGLGGLNPSLAGQYLHTYLAVPVVTESLSAYMGLLAGYAITVNSGHYRRYLKWMWLFASIAAVVNVKNGWHVGDGTHLTAFLLGGLSFGVPLVWHFYAGITLQVKHTRLSIAELAAISRGWVRHPLFSIRTARAVDLFPEKTRADVWEMVIRNHRVKLVNKWTTDPRQRSRDAEALATAPVKVSMVTTLDDIMRRWWKRSTPPVDVVPPSPVNDDVHDVHGERSPHTTSGVNVLDREGLAAEAEPEQPAETTGELRRRSMVTAAYYAEPREHPRGYQARVARELNVSKALVSKVFSECRAQESQSTTSGKAETKE